MEEESGIFKKRPGSHCFSVFDKPEERHVRNGDFNFQKIADEVAENGISEFHFSEADLWQDRIDVKPPKPYVRLHDNNAYDVYDTRDANYPTSEKTDIPSANFHRGVRRVTAYPAGTQGMEDLTQDGGVKKRILYPGNDKSGEVLDGYRVWIHYDTYLDNGNGEKLTLHDSTADHRMATSIVVGKDGLLGLQLALKTMRLGEVAEVALAPEYAYGPLGIPGFIDKLQSLRLVVELREIRRSHKKPLVLMPESERKCGGDLPFDELMNNVEELIEAGKKKFTAKRYREASDRYTWALELLQDDTYSAYEEERKISLKAFQLHSNLALCYIRMEDYDLARASSEAALNQNFHNIDLKPKVLYRLALSNLKLQQYHDCIAICDAGAKSSSWGRAEFRDLKYQAKCHQVGKAQKVSSEEITPGVPKEEYITSIE